MKKSLSISKYLQLIALGCVSCAGAPQSKEEVHEPSVPFRLEVFQDENGLYGYQDSSTSEIVIPGVFTKALPFANGLAAVCEELHLDHISVQRCGYINTLGEVQIPFIFSGADSHNETYRISTGNKIIVAPVKLSSLILFGALSTPLRTILITLTC